MILTPKQIEEIEAKCKPGSRPFGSSVRKRLEHFQSLLETVKDLQSREQRARELLKRALPCTYGAFELQKEIEDYLK